MDLLDFYSVSIFIRVLYRMFMIFRTNERVMLLHRIILKISQKSICYFFITTDLNR